ncbi:unnamed protein product [Rhizopus microsporus]
MGQKITNKVSISNSVALGFEDFKAEHPSIGYSDALSAACVAPATAYLNHITFYGLQARLPIPSTVKSLAASPTKFVPALAAIISELEILCDEHEDDNSKTPRRFPLMPTPSMGWRYISINAKALQYITKHKSNGTYKDNKFGYESLDKVLESQNKFTCCIETDGFGACFAFARKAKEEK